jgi:hypothetical protein
MGYGMNDREYLRSLGFEVGDRGRFSKEMKAALASRDGVDPDAPEPEYGAQEKFADGRYRIERSNGLPRTPDVPGIDFGPGLAVQSTRR